MNPKRLLLINGNGKKRGNNGRVEPQTVGKTGNWKQLPPAPDRGTPWRWSPGRPGFTRFTPGRTACSARVPERVRDLRRRRRRSPPRPTRPPSRDPGTTGFGGQVRARRECAARPGKRPVRADFTRQECAPPPPPPRGARPRVSPARPPGAAPRPVPTPSGPRTARPGNSRARLPAPFRGPSGAPNSPRP